MVVIIINNDHIEYNSPLASIDKGIRRAEWGSGKGIGLEIRFLPSSDKNYSYDLGPVHLVLLGPQFLHLLDKIASVPGFQLWN